MWYSTSALALQCYVYNAVQWGTCKAVHCGAILVHHESF